MEESEAQAAYGYILGQHFLSDLHSTMDGAAFSAAMGNLYGAYVAFRCYSTKQHVYDVFLRHTPVGRSGSICAISAQVHLLAAINS